MERPVDFWEQRETEDRAEDHEGDRAVFLEDGNRLVTVDRHQNGERDDDQEGDRVQQVALRQAGEASQLDKRLRCDHAIDREPTDRQEEREEGAGIGPTKPECVSAGRDHLGRPEPWPRDAQEAVQAGGQHRADRDGENRLRHPEPEGDEQCARDQRDEVGKRGNPEPGNVARRPLTLGRRNRLDATRLDLEKLVGRSLTLNHVFPPLALPRSGSRVGGAFHLSAFQTHPVRFEYIYQ